MGFSGSGAVLCVVGLILVLFGGGHGRKLKEDQRYITWDDLTLETDESLLTTPGQYNSRIIVVDGNGWGDSLTVQAAVDMVPEHNTQRVKIEIRPGVYRSLDGKSFL